MNGFFSAGSTPGRSSGHGKTHVRSACSACRTENALRVPSAHVGVREEGVGCAGQHQKPGLQTLPQCLCFFYLEKSDTFRPSLKNREQKVKQRNFASPETRMQPKFGELRLFLVTSEAIFTPGAGRGSGRGCRSSSIAAASRSQHCSAGVAFGGTSSHPFARCPGWQDSLCPHRRRVPTEEVTVRPRSRTRERCRAHRAGLRVGFLTARCLTANAFIPRLFAVSCCPSSAAIQPVVSIH